MVLLTKADLAFRAKLQYATRTIATARAKIKSAKKRFGNISDLSDTKEIIDLSALEESLVSLVSARDDMKREYEVAKLRFVGLQMADINANQKAFMQAIKKAKTDIPKFNDVTALNPTKKAKKFKL
jgi:hypothetical protein